MTTYARRLGLFSGTVAAAIFVVASSIAANPRNALTGAGLLALGVPAYLFWTRAERRQ